MSESDTDNEKTETTPKKGDLHVTFVSGTDVDEAWDALQKMIAEANAEE